MNKNGPVLIISNPKDPHTDAVIHFLYKMGIEVIRFHVAESYIDSDIVITASKSEISIISSKRQFNRNKLRSVWFRRPDRFEEYIKNLTYPDKHLVPQETNAVMWGLYGQIDAVWYSHPYNIRKAAWKIYQLSIAKNVGFNIPPFLISNNTKAISLFLSKIDEIVLKPIDEKTTFYEYKKKAYSLYVKKFKAAQLKKLSKKKPISPVYLQKYIKKKYDVRITVIGKTIFTVAILQPKDIEGEITDFRPYSLELDYKVINCPSKIKENIFQYLKIMGLNFGAFDFVVDINNKWHFLECNPNGQWLWIELKTGLPMVETFAKHLALKKPYICKGI